MKNILITGVSGGMGYATAKFLVEKGYTIFGVDIAESNDLPIHYYRADLRNQVEIETVFKDIQNKVEELYAILHFVGIYTMHSLVEISEEEFLKIFDVNLFSVYRINKTFLPLLRKGSRIGITSSELAPLNPLPFTGLYAITKVAIEKYAYALRMELNLLGIRVSIIRPGAVDTGMIDSSVISLDRLCNETELYQYNTLHFRNIVNSVETRRVSPRKIAKISLSLLNSKHPKYVYNINRNFLLRFFSILPKHFQVGVIARILKKKKR